MAIRSTVTISPGLILTIGILLLSLQNVLTQQCCNNNVRVKKSDGCQQSLPKTTFGLNQVTQNSGVNIHAPQQANMQQMNFQQQSNIQQAPFPQQTSNLQPQWNLQQTGSQQTVNSISNSQLLQQQNQDLASNIFSAFQNIRPSSPDQGTNVAKDNSAQPINSYILKQNVQQIPQMQNQPSAAFVMTAPMNKPQAVAQPVVESPQFQPTLTFHTVPSMTAQNNNPSQQNQQNYLPTAQNSYANEQNNGYYIQNQPAPSPATGQQATVAQSPMVMVAGSQPNAVQTQPIVLTLQAPQMLPVHIPPTLQSQPITYTVQTQPASISSQNQQKIAKPQNRSKNAPIDQSLMYYVMSQIQNQFGNDNALASILPEILNTKSEKSSMKALLPLIFNLMNDGKSGCECPHCGCNKKQEVLEPVINTGYSNQKNYSSQEPKKAVSTKISEDEMQPTASGEDSKKIENEITEESVEASEEEDYSEEDYDDE